MTIHNSQQLNDLKAILASVYFLEKEAQRAGLREISVVLRNSIGTIEKWMDDENNPHEFTSTMVADSKLYEILRLLDKFSSVSRFDLQATLHAIDAFSEMKRIAH